MNYKIMKNEFAVPASESRAVQTIKKSRFIATVGRAASVEDAKIFIERIRIEFPDASHNCWAYQTCEPGSTASVGMSDDGEPHYTAGKPMLTLLINSGIGEIAAVVTRYFGGIKLGTGGLIKAYSNVLKNALYLLEVKKKIVTCNIAFNVKYNDIGSVRRISGLFKAVIIKVDYNKNVSFQISIRKDRVDEFKTALTDVLNYQSIFNTTNS